MLRPTHPPGMLLQVPGGLELLIILLVMALLVGVPVVLAGVFLFTRFVGGGDDDEVAELKARVDELEAELAAGSEAAHNEVTVEDERADEGGAADASERHRADDTER